MDARRRAPGSQQPAADAHRPPLATGLPPAPLGGFISHLERGRANAPLYVYLAIADVLEVDAGALLGPESVTMAATEAETVLLRWLAPAAPSRTMRFSVWATRCASSHSDPPACGKPCAGEAGGEDFVAALTAPSGTAVPVARAGHGVLEPPARVPRALARPVRQALHGQAAGHAVHGHDHRPGRG